jgi:hypothetical protein
MRRTIGNRTFFAAFAAAFVVIGSAWAQAPADATTTAARARFQEGVELFDRGDYESARVAFLQALALKRHPVVLLNVAQCALRTNRPLEAKRTFEAFLAEATSATPAQKDEARKGIADASLKTPRIVVDTETARRVLVDGVATPVTARGTVVEVEVGSHRFTLEGAGGVTLRDGERAFAAGESFELRATETPVSAVTAVVAVPVTPAAAPTPSVSSDASAATGSKSDLFAAPENIVPVYAGLGVGAAGTVGAVVFLLAKKSATDNANQTEAIIRGEGGGRGTCSSTNPNPAFANLCATLRENYDAIDKDALFGNISLGAAIAGTAFGVGWYLFAPKKAPSAEAGLVIAPHVDLLGSQKIVGLSGHF